MKRDVIIILILLFITVIAWATTSIYRNLVRSTISQNTSRDILPIAPVFDTNTIDKIKNRERVIPAFELENKITPVEKEEEATSGGEIVK